ncbi:MAG: cytochrome c [Phycisphaerae bacterium]|jgi:mono/diheme cytochrome c family protein|nr:cytochrome c [Phycisphaerae bacterium]
MSSPIPRALLYVGGTVACLLLIPPAAIAYIRSQSSPGRPVHLIWDMDNQAKYKAQEENPLFADGRAARPIVAGTVAMGEANLDTHFTEGVTGPSAEWATTLPAGLVADETFMRRGQERFNIYCSPCHGFAGFGDGMVNRRAMTLMNNSSGSVDNTSWTQAKNLHEDQIRAQPIGQIYHSLSYGIRTMAGYSAQIPTEDRWAIASYVKALQRSQNAAPQDIPPDRRTQVGSEEAATVASAAPSDQANRDGGHDRQGAVNQ